MLKPLALLILLLLYQTLPVGGILCLYCPFERKEESCPIIETQCREDEFCYTASGQYSGIDVLSGKGCLARDKCDIEGNVRYKGISYSVTYACCRENMCNAAHNTHPSRVLLVFIPGLVAVWLMGQALNLW
ncbi:protein Bouncer [Polypterus senegalus]